MSWQQDDHNRRMRQARANARAHEVAIVAPPSYGNPGRSVIVVASNVVGFAIDEYVKCVSGVWTKLIDTDAGPLMCGVVVAVDGQQALVQRWGLRAKAGTQGSIYYAGTTAGSSTTTAPVATEGVAATQGARVIESQEDAGLRMVWPEWFPMRVLTVTTCESSGTVETTRKLLETL